MTPLRETQGPMDDASYRGPVKAAYQMLRHLADKDADAVWRLYAPDLKRALTQQWVFERVELLEWTIEGDIRDLVLLVDQLIEVGDRPPWEREDPLATMWAMMMETLLDEVEYTVPFDWVAHLRAGTLGASQRVRVVPPRFELVVLMPTAGFPIVFSQPTEVPAVFVLVEPAAGGWLVNSFTATPSAPADLG